MLRSLMLTTAVLAAPAYADGVEYGRLSYDYTNFDNDSQDAYAGVFQGSIEYGIGSILLNGDIRHFDANGDSSAYNYQLGAGYEFTPEILVALDITGVDGEDIEGVTGFDLNAQYQTAQFGAAIEVAKFNSDEDNITTTLFGEYYIAATAAIGAMIDTQSETDGSFYRINLDYDAGPLETRTYYAANTEIDGGLFGIHGTYAFNQQLRLSAGFENFTLADDSSAKFYSIGGGYQIVEGLWFDADYGQFDADDSNETKRLQVAMTFDLGAQKRIDNRFRQAVVDDAQAGFGSF